MKVTHRSAGRWREVARRFVGQDLPKDRGSRARLRRASTCEALYSIERAHQLVAAFGLADEHEPLQELGYRLASLLALLPEDAASTQGSLGQALGRENVYSKLRFARLLRSRKPADRYQQFRRALAQIKYRVDPGELAQVFLQWHTDAVQRGVAYEYFQTSAPDALADDTSNPSSAPAEAVVATPDQE